MGSLPTFKLILLGDSGVGKSSLLMRTNHQTFTDVPASTIMVDCSAKDVKTSRRQVKFRLWDTAGTERHRSLTQSYFRNAHAVLLVFDVNDSDSLDKLSSWVNDALYYAPQARIFMLGNKTDLGFAVDLQSTENFATVKDIDSIFLVSAKTGEGVEEAMTSIGDRLLQYYCFREYSSSSVALKESKFDRRRRKCCSNG